MAAPTEVFLQLSLLLVIAVVSHFVIRQFRQPTIIGEILIGIILGPSLLGRMGFFAFDESLIAIFAALGAIFLLFVVGLESDIRAIYTRRNFLVALGGVLLPLGFGFVVAYLMVPEIARGVGATQFTVALFVGATLVATSTAIAASILLEMGLMQERIAQVIMGAVVVDDVLGLLILSIVVGMSRGAFDAFSVGKVIILAVVFLVVAIVMGLYLFRRAVVQIQAAAARLGIRHGGFITAMAITFLYAFVAEALGLSAIIGAFVAGTLFATTALREEFKEGAGYLGAIFTPIFFISLGLLVDLGAVAAVPEFLPFAVVLTAVAIVTKVVGCAIPARLAKMTKNESLAVGWGMTPRG
ncbi:MAG: hypothetical protein A3K65_00655, partial [Euryarchaeota archaeon RBG_16_68_12]